VDSNLREPFWTRTSAGIGLADRYWELWLAIWGIDPLLLVERWDNTMRAFAKGAQPLLRPEDNPAEHPQPVPNPPASSKGDNIDVKSMHNLAKPVPVEPQVYVFCPSCGELTTIKAMGPMMLEPSMEEITYCCVACGTETRVQLSKHARLCINANEARYFAN
jgi:hypothetical protein